MKTTIFVASGTDRKDIGKRTQENTQRKLRQDHRDCLRASRYLPHYHSYDPTDEGAENPDEEIEGHVASETRNCQLGNESG